MLCIFNKYIFVCENVQCMRVWLDSPVPKTKSFLNDDIKKKAKIKRIRVDIVDVYVGIQSSDVIFFTYVVGFKISNIVGDVREISFFESKKEVDPRYISIRALRHLWYLTSWSVRDVRTLETMISSELRVQSWWRRAWFWIHRHQYHVLVIFFFETARNSHLKDSRKPRSCLLHVIRNIFWVHWYRSFHDVWQRVKKRRNVFLISKCVLSVFVQNLTYWSHIVSKKVFVNLVEELILRSILDLKQFFVVRKAKQEIDIYEVVSFNIICSKKYFIYLKWRSNPKY